MRSPWFWANKLSVMASHGICLPKSERLALSDPINLEDNDVLAMFVKVSWLPLQCRALICCLDLKRMLWLIWRLIIDDGYRIQYVITDDYWWLLMITVPMIDYWLWWFIIYLTSPYEIQQKEIRTCSRASTFWLRFSWRSKLWSQKHLASTGHLAWMYLMDSRIASLYPAMMVSEFEDWESMGKRTVDMSSTETRLKYVEMLIGIRTVGWMLFFTSSLARFNLGKCVIRGLRCGQSLAQIGPMQFRCDDHDRSGSITHFSVLHAQRNKTKVGNDMKWHEMTSVQVQWQDGVLILQRLRIT